MAFLLCYHRTRGVLTPVQEWRQEGTFARSQRVAESSAGTAATAPPFTSAPDVYERFCCSSTSTIGSTHHGDHTAQTIQAQSHTQLEEGRKSQLDGSAGFPPSPEREDDLGMGSLQPDLASLPPADATRQAYLPLNVSVGAFTIAMVYAASVILKKAVSPSKASASFPYVVPTSLPHPAQL
ncbi:hypothetical protein BKA70DRAFT_1452633 [Coprinopsis sp. MPI-PUGE-AT-0042]|nr:hypothetical protein BKA70DRAFT_1452633 [Coprinopsis sp. MPI-PUGE-AT-0042]